jgi:hypothetical protein
MTFLKLSSLVLLFVATIGSSASASCSKASVSGVWGFQIGTAIGQFTADGRGDVTAGSLIINQHGTILKETFTGTYSVASGCTGSLAIKATGIGTVTVNFVLDNSNKGAQMIDTTTGSVADGIGSVEGGTCGVSEAAGSYAALLLGKTTTAKIAYVAQVILDGRGNVSGTGTFDLSGVIHVASLTGTYTEGPNCEGSIRMTPEGLTAMNFDFIVVNAGKELLLLETDSDASVAGNMQR